MEQLVQVLAAGTSDNPQSVRQAEKELEAWQGVSGYHAALQDVYLNEDLPYNVRYLAILTLKNGVNRYWRKSSPRLYVLKMVVRRVASN